MLKPLLKSLLSRLISHLAHAMPKNKNAIVGLKKRFYIHNQQQAFLFFYGCHKSKSFTIFIHIVIQLGRNGTLSHFLKNAIGKRLKIQC